ncbi:MAG: putative rane protein [Candidatus Acidoferrum typicum]|nr:putative rane protein [Candidatus Acidoferrum typicum]
MDARAQPSGSLLKLWLPAIAWAILISGLSTDTFSSDRTSRYILPVLQWLLPRASGDTLEWLQFLIRKTAHFTEYFAFSFLLLRAVRGQSRGWKIRWAITALVIAAGYSALDEFHQWFVPSRTASPWDSLLDTTGAATAQFVLWLWFQFRTRHDTYTVEEVAPAARD